jgi:hypothetical protein
MPLPTKLTPRRSAGASVLASLGGGVLAPDPAAAMAAPMAADAEVHNDGAMMMQHDYLLQNLVHVSSDEVRGIIVFLPYPPHPPPLREWNSDRIARRQARD